MQNLIGVLKENQIPFLVNEPLKNWCTFKIGGIAPLFIEPSCETDIAIVITQVKKQGFPLLVLGRGSNVLISDDGFDGVVMHLGKNMATIKMLDDRTIYCQSGAKLTELCLFALKQELAGMEALYGIPGSVGGAVYMNAGAYGGETKDIVVSAEHVDTNGEKGFLSLEELDLSYRHSAYTGSERIITAVTVRLKKGNPVVIRAKMDEYMGKRLAKQPLEYASAGSTFKRPVGNYASALIDQCSLKGLRIGDAMVSEKHAGFVVNVGNATFKDVVGVIDSVKNEVFIQKGVELECEIKIIDTWD